MNGTGDSLFRNVPFMRLWVGQGISFVGDAVSMIALVVLVVQITGSASAVGGVLVARVYRLVEVLGEVPQAGPLAALLLETLDALLVALGWCGHAAPPCDTGLNRENVTHSEQSVDHGKLGR
jgi:hypothetical protein